MEKWTFRPIAVAGLIGITCLAVSAQQSQRQRPEGAEGDLTQRLLAFDKNKDGKLTKEEITDETVLPLFTRADANNDGVVTGEELKALAARGSSGGRGPAGPGQRPGGFGGQGGFAQGGFGARPQPGQVLGTTVQETLKLSEEQKRLVAELQKEVDAKLAKILTEDQQKQMKEIGTRAPGGFGQPGGAPGGFGRPGGGGGAPGGFGRPGGGGDASALLERLKGFDKNKDGKLAKDELPENMQTQFERADANKDGVLDEKELKQLADSMGQGAPGRPGAGGGRPPRPDKQ